MDQGEGSLVHGKILAGYPKRWMGHAWVEFGSQIYDPVLDETIDKEKYYDLVSARPSKSYGFETALEKVITTRHMGPW